MSQWTGGTVEDFVQFADHTIDEQRSGPDGLQYVGRQASPVDDVNVGRAASLFFDATESRQRGAQQSRRPIDK